MVTAIINHAGYWENMRKAINPELMMRGLRTFLVFFYCSSKPIEKYVVVLL